MKKYPFVKQEGLKDCGVACLSMIISFYKGYIPLEKLRDITKTNKNGVTAYHLIEAAKKIGLDAKGIKIEDLNINFKLPCIAFVTIDKSFNHYVVIYEINKEKKEIIIADPASRIKKMSLEEFKKIFNNVIIIFNFQKRLPLYTKPENFIKFTTNILKSHKKKLIKIILLSFFITIFSIITSFYIEIVFNKIEYLSKSLLLFVTLVFSCIYFLKNIFDYIRNKLLLNINKEIETTLTNDIFKKIILLPYQYFKNRTTGEVLTKINDLRIINETIIKVILIIILDLTLALFSIIFLFMISYKLFIVSVIIFILYTLIIFLFKNKLSNNLELIKDNESLLNSYIVEHINGFETIKGLSIEEKVIKKYKDKNNEMLTSNYSYEKLYILEHLLKNIISEIGLLIILFVGFILVIEKEITIGNLITYNALFIYFINPIKNIIEIFKDIKEATLSYNRINEIIYNQKEINNYKNLKFESIDIKELSYSHNLFDNNLENISLKINKGEKVMIIGASGSGKSTLLKLLKKYYDIDNKKIYIDNVDINKISKEEIDKNITYVSQNEILFTDTLYNNLSLNRNLKQEKINEVIKDANINFLDKNLGLNMFIEENGFNLSGGEKQRIVLARTLINKFKILILDEALSEVDINLERKILKNIFKRYNDSIIILVSHRYNNIDLFDKVINLEEGKIKTIERKNRKNISKKRKE